MHKFVVFLNIFYLVVFLMSCVFIDTNLPLLEPVAAGRILFIGPSNQFHQTQYDSRQKKVSNTFCYFTVNSINIIFLLTL